MWRSPTSWAPRRSPPSARPLPSLSLPLPGARRPAPTLAICDRHVVADRQSCAWSAVEGCSEVPLRHLAQVHRLVVGLLVDTFLVGDLAQHATGAGGLLDDLGRLVVADVRIERRGRRQRRLGRAVTALLVGLDPGDALLGEDP